MQLALTMYIKCWTKHVKQFSLQENSTNLICISLFMFGRGVEAKTVNQRLTL